MGLLDLPPISEMDALEKKARKGDEETLRKHIYGTLRPGMKLYVDRLMHRDGLSLQAALSKAGVMICIR